MRFAPPEKASFIFPGKENFNGSSGVSDQWEWGEHSYAVSQDGFVICPPRGVFGVAEL